MSNTSYDIEPTDPTDAQQRSAVAAAISRLFAGIHSISEFAERARQLTRMVEEALETDSEGAARRADLARTADRVMPFLMGAQTSFLPFQAEAPNQPPTQPDPSAVVEGSLEPVDEAA